MQDKVVELGVGGIFSLLVLKETLSFWRSRNNKNHNGELLRMTRDLHQWHDVSDPATGGKIWYVNRTLQDAIIRLSENIDKQTRLLERFDDHNSRMASQLDEIHRCVRKGD